VSASVGGARDYAPSLNQPAPISFRGMRVHGRGPHPSLHAATNCCSTSLRGTSGYFPRQQRISCAAGERLRTAKRQFIRRHHTSEPTQRKRRRREPAVCPHDDRRHGAGAVTQPEKKNSTPGTRENDALETSSPRARGNVAIGPAGSPGETTYGALHVIRSNRSPETASKSCRGGHRVGDSRSNAALSSGRQATRGLMSVATDATRMTSGK